ncbi:MAG: SDR family NAD(P)-dependent oxidoreductase, partial [Gemmatimonadota bacterium]
MGTRPLAGTVAVVTGSSRGGGRGIALALGDAGATVYVTGRSSRETGATQGRPETVEETAERVTERGGSGVAVRCDHTDQAAVQGLFERVAGEAGRLDVLVSNAWGGYERPVETVPFWEVPMEHWDLMFDAGLRAQVVTAREAMPLLLEGGRLVVNTLSPVGERYQGSLFYDLVNQAKRRLTVTMAHELRPRGVAVVGV